MNIDKIAALIKTKRKEKGITQAELAAKLGITEKAVSRWETGRGTPDISLLIPLSKELNVSVLELLNGESIQNEDEAVVEIIKTKNKTIKLWKYISLIIINLLFILASLIVIYSYLIAPKYEYGAKRGMVTILSESMAPDLKVKDTIIYDKLPISDVKIDDVIAYYYPHTAIKTAHRVIGISSENNEVRIKTKGDNNLEEDTYYVTSDNYLGIYHHKLSKFNNLFLTGQLRVSSNTSAVLGFLLLYIFSVIYLDTLQIVKFLKNK